MKYFWSTKTLRNDVKLLERMYKEEINPRIKEEIAACINEAKAYIFEEEVEDKDKIDDLDALCRAIPIFQEYYPYISEYRKKLQSYVDKEYEKETEMSENTQEKNRKLSKDDVMDLVNELYKSIGGEIYQQFSKIFKNRFNNTRFQKQVERPSMIFIPGLNKPYMTLMSPEDDTYRTVLLSATHELAHGTASLINPRRYYGEEYYFNEIETFFFELVAQDYFACELNDKGFYDDAKCILLSQTDISEDILWTKKIADKRYKLGNPSKEKLLEKLTNKVLKSLIEGDIYSEPDDDIKYLFSYIVAIELYEVYKVDKYLALEMLNSIIDKKENESELESIRKIVTPNKSLIKYKNYIERKIKS